MSAPAFSIRIKHLLAFAYVYQYNPDMRFAYALAAYAVLIAMVWRRDGRHPWFLAHCAATAFWLPVYQSHDEVWLAYWQMPMYAMLVGLRFAAAAEVVWRLGSAGGRLRWLLRGSTCVAIGWVLIAWRIAGDLDPVVQARNYIQIGEAVFLGIPMWVCLKYCEDADLRHGCILLALLSVHASVSWILLAGVRFSHGQWVAVDAAANATAISCCLLWINPLARGVSPGHSDGRESRPASANHLAVF